MPGTTHDGDRSSDEARLERVLVLLSESLEILDGLGDFPDLGARLQQVIESLEERRSDHTADH